MSLHLLSRSIRLHSPLWVPLGCVCLHYNHHCVVLFRWLTPLAALCVMDGRSDGNVVNGGRISECYIPGGWSGVTRWHVAASDHVFHGCEWFLHRRD